MEDLGQPSSYLELTEGRPVYASDGAKVGVVEHVLRAAEEDIFDGIVLDTSVLPGGHRFVDAPQVEEIYDNGVVLSIDGEAAEALPEPSANPGVLEAEGDEPPASPLQQKLRRAWDLISGNY